ncbi:microtubule-associated tyrosine carboxypeptidase 1-like [Tubulanus polymorphus]|uniref:microtubule-associated tyrosine carboxypeptidase 1-like n=1 Tax=Tubulanus polymorphus TaxID=672921 RepID=UPI003DA50D9E
MKAETIILQGHQKVKKPKYQRKGSVIQTLVQTPLKYVPKFTPTNLLEQKEQFLTSGIVPKFNFKGSQEAIEKIISTKKAEIRFTYMAEAKKCLDLTKEQFGSVDTFVAEAYGKRINHLEASAYLAQYLTDHNIEGSMKIVWSPDLACSAQMCWQGPNIRYNKPEARKYTLWIKNSSENTLLREHGIKGLADHEIGTHFFRNLNDGFQPWFSDRKKFGLKGLQSKTLQCTEEGIATIHTLLSAQHHFLAVSALTYYTACMSTKMKFRELFDHLQQYVIDPEQRWKHVMRVKRGLEDPDEMGGYGKDQCYFEGAVEILRNIDKIDFTMLMSGKVCWKDIPRIKRVVRVDCIKLPQLMRNLDKYKKKLREVARINGIATYTKPCVRKSSRTKRTSKTTIPVNNENKRKNSAVSVNTTKPVNFSPQKAAPTSCTNVHSTTNKLYDRFTKAGDTAAYSIQQALLDSGRRLMRRSKIPANKLQEMATGQLTMVKA